MLLSLVLLAVVSKFCTYSMNIDRINNVAPLTSGNPAPADASSARGPDVMFAGLNTIRFLCAVWVLLGHFQLPNLAHFMDTSTVVGSITRAIYENSFKGPPAVIVFFVISGFCIHYPHSSQNQIPSVPAYFARRYIRIAGPMIPAIWIATYLLDINLSLFDRTILWSLLAELIYYALYPAILWIRRSSIGWVAMIAMSFGVAIVIAAANPTMESYPASGPYLAWLLGLPSWLMGCKLAEHIRENPREAADPSIWLWRFGVFVLGLACNVAKGYSPVGYPWTLNLFALFASVWLLKELHHFQRYRAPAVLEWAGSWSYSLYLFHNLAMAMIVFLPTINAGTRTNWVYHLLFVFCSSLAFALLVEFPSHALARAISRWVRGATSPFAARA